MRHFVNRRLTVIHAVSQVVFPLGSWVGGLFTTFCLRSIAGGIPSCCPRGLPRRVPRHLVSVDDVFCGSVVGSVAVLFARPFFKHSVRSFVGLFERPYVGPFTRPFRSTFTGPFIRPFVGVFDRTLEGGFLRHFFGNSFLREST